MNYYRVKGWSDHFENSDSRKLKELRFVLLPNKHDGLGFRRIAALEDGPQIFAAWTLMLQVASKGRGDARGALIRDGQPLDADDLAVMTGFDASIFYRAFDILTNRKVGWLELVDENGQAVDPAENPNKNSYPLPSPGNPGESPDVPGESPGLSGNAPENLPTNGMEWKEGKVRNGRKRREERESDGADRAAQLMDSSRGLILFPENLELTEKHRMRAFQKGLDPDDQFDLCRSHYLGLSERRTAEEWPHVVDAWFNRAHPAQRTPARASPNLTAGEKTTEAAKRLMERARRLDAEEAAAAAAGGST